MALVSINPTSGETLHRFPEHSRTQVDQMLVRANQAFTAWRELAPRDRARKLRALASALESEKAALAPLITAEMGKPIVQAQAEIEKCAVVCRHYAQHGPAFLAPERPAGAPRKAKVVFEPLGPLLAIMPWNFPFWQVFRAAVPALMAGNTILVKHSSNVCGCALAIEEVFKRAGFPRGVFQVLLVGSAAIPRLIADDQVKGVTLTGSTAAGRQVATAAATALKPCVLELGGSDPYVVLADANLTKAAELCAEAKLLNAGQSCIAAKRFIVVEAVRRAFETRLVECLAKRAVGDPTDAMTQVGPLARSDLRDDVHRQVRDSLKQGARLLMGGEIPAGPGFFYPPTVLTQVRAGMPAYEQEIFGPVAAIIPVPDEATAIAVANDSRFGLGAALFTRNRRRGEEIAREQLQAGMVFINDFVRSDVSLPFGGIKQSGLGRELGVQGLRSFVNIKTLWNG